MFDNAKMLWIVIKRLRFDRMLLIFIIVYCIISLIIYFVEPGINNVGDAFWYTFVACTSIGFGDVVVTTVAARILTVIITVYELAMVALFSGVIVSFYLELVRRKEDGTMANLVYKLEHLTELSTKELKEIEDKAKMFAKKR